MDAAIEIWNPADDIWKRLRSLAFVKFSAKSESEPSWTGTAEGVVKVESLSKEILIISETGIWNPARGQPSRFKNVFRWTRLAGDALRLEHLRFGPENPVHLFDLGSDMNEDWESIDAHVCKEDCYSAMMRPHPTGVDIWWSISGPKKQTSIAYEYRWYNW